MHSRTRVLFVLLSLVMSSAVFAQTRETPRTASGRPDLSGTYDVATLTPLERPAEYGDRLVLTEEEAAAIAANEPEALATIFNYQREVNSNSDADDANRTAPPVGGDGSTGAAGNVGGYNTFWMDRGTTPVHIEGQWRTSIITDPANGRRPPLTSAARDRRDARDRQVARGAYRRPNDGTAFWILENGPDAPGRTTTRRSDRSANGVSRSGELVRRCFRRCTTITSASCRPTTT